MKRAFFLIVLLNVFVSCSTVKKNGKESAYQLSNKQIETVIDRGVKALLGQSWLSAFLMQHNERPILMTANFTNKLKAGIDMQKVYNYIEMSLIESGQVRVVKSNEQQRILLPYKLAKGKSVDYVLSATFEKKQNSVSSVFVCRLSLWNENPASPVATAETVIN